MNQNGSVRKIAVASVLVAVALTIYVLEANIPPLAPVPGVKLGLSNIVTIFTLYIIGPKVALAVLACRIILSGFIVGQPAAILYGMCGGLLAFLFAALAYRKFPKKQIWVLSAISAVLHNLGQITVAALVAGTSGLFIYIPALVTSGIITGAFTGTAAQLLLDRLVKAGILKYYGEI